MVGALFSNEAMTHNNRYRLLLLESVGGPAAALLHRRVLPRYHQHRPHADRHRGVRNHLRVWISMLK